MEITREDLYVAVWREPMTRLAPAYGMSQFALASLCRKLQVPAPPRGHWSKLAHGKPSPRPPLPAFQPEGVKEDAPRRERPARPEVPTPPAAPLVAPVRKPVLLEGRPEQAVAVVSERLTNPHPAVRATADAMVGVERDSYGTIRPRRYPVRPDAPVPLDIRVSPGLKMRALRLADALLKALLARGYSFDAGKHEDRPRGQYGTSPAVVIAGERVPFAIEEKSDRKAHVPTPKEKAETQRYSWRTHAAWDHTPSGKLSLRIDVVVGWTDGIRKRWSDRGTAMVEESLDDIVAGMVEVGEALRRHTEEEARREAERREREKQRQEEERRQKIEAARREELEARADAWGRAATLRRFVAEIQARLRDEPEGGSREAREWVAWASSHADCLDPLARGIEALIRDVEAAGAKAVAPAYSWMRGG